MDSIDLVIYGIKRGFPNTKCAYTELVDNLNKDFNVRVIEVLNVIGKYTNIRSNEVSVEQNLEYFFDDSIKIEKDFRCGKNFVKLLNYSKEFTDLHDDNYKSNENLIQQLLMLHEASDRLNSKFTLIIRDDLKLDFKLLIQKITKIKKYVKDKEMITSFYHSNRGLSERWTFSNRKTAKILLRRSSLVEKFLNESDKYSYCSSQGLNGEWLMRYTCEAHKILPVAIPIFSYRIRANSVIHKERIFSHPRHWYYEWFTVKALLRFYFFR